MHSAARSQPKWSDERIRPGKRDVLWTKSKSRRNDMKKRSLPTVLIFLCVAGVTSTSFADSNGPAAVAAAGQSVNQAAVTLATVSQARPLLDRIALGEGGTYDRINTYYER